MNSYRTVWAFTPDGFPHSDIHGSLDICSSPWLFAACHVLRRLKVPRHSPCALCNLTFLVLVDNPDTCFKVSFNKRSLYPFRTSDTRYAEFSFSFGSSQCLSYLRFSYAVFKVRRLSSCLAALLSFRKVVETTRFELVTSCVQGRRSPI